MKYKIIKEYQADDYPFEVVKENLSYKEMEKFLTERNSEEVDGYGQVIARYYYAEQNAEVQFYSILPKIINYKEYERNNKKNDL